MEEIIDRQDGKGSIPLDMYEVPGHGAINDHVLKRYLTANKIWEQKLLEIVELEQSLKKRIQFAPENERAELIREALENQDIEVQRKAIEMIWFAPENEQAGLRQIVAEKIANKIREALENLDVEVQKKAAEMIQYAPENEQAGLRQIVAGKIREALKNQDIEVQKETVEMIQFALEDERAELIREALESSAVEVQKEAAERIWSAPENERAELIREALENQDIEVQRKAIEMIWFAPENEQAGLRQIVAEKIANKIHEALESPYIEVQRKAAEMIWFAPINEQAELFMLAMKKIPDAIIEPPLYKSSGIKGDKFSREEFPKTGSETTLIGGSLMNKVIVRHISSESFLAWKELYEDYAFWRENGFDYVPIEPIVSYRLGKNGQVAVFSGVLDLSLAQWLDMTSLFKDELLKQRDKILKALEEKGYIHGHPHDDNFCLRFERDEEGRPKIDTPPRVYLIDFDQARFESNN